MPWVCRLPGEDGEMDPVAGDFAPNVSCRLITLAFVFILDGGAAFFEGAAAATLMVDVIAPALLPPATSLVRELF